MEDTICGIATCLGQSAINIIRVSGNESLNIVQKIFSRSLQNIKSHQILYGNIIDKKNNELIDEVLLMVFLKPKTYTKEDLIEIQCHGGSFVTKKILDLLLNSGARLAQEGEFTKRAFLNGRIDLSKAEAVMDIIKAKTESSLKYANKALQGEIYELINNLQNEMVEIISLIEVNIDYPEYEDVEVMTRTKLIPMIKVLLQKMESIYEKSKTGKFIRDGINVLIIGKPNVGKSSLLNNLLDEDLAIVTDIPGTTRDKIIGSLNINGILVNLVDTAGIHETNDEIEKIGVKIAQDAIESSDIVILMLDASKNLEKTDYKLFDLIKNKNSILVMNKIDIEEKFKLNDSIKISVKKKFGIDLLKSKIYEKAGFNDFNNDLEFLTNVRQINLLQESITSLKYCLTSLEKGITVDMAEIDLKEAWIKLKEILGMVSTEDLLDEVFKRFCLGK